RNGQRCEPPIRLEQRQINGLIHLYNFGDKVSQRCQSRLLVTLGPSKVSGGFVGGWFLSVSGRAGGVPRQRGQRVLIQANPPGSGFQTWEKPRLVKRALLRVANFV
ncbi:MAG: hypothetical protein HY674_09665, partial [Chloroflexi bacterium]|nr:hypothetical protein [Chloroflexota bacterium]